jgi:hypothetical protein
MQQSCIKQINSLSFTPAPCSTFSTISTILTGVRRPGLLKAWRL